MNGEYEIVHRDEVIKLRPEAHVGHVGHAGHVGPLVWRRVRNRDEDKEHSSRWIWFDGSAWLIGDVRSGDSLYCVYDEFDLGVRHSLLPTIYGHYLSHPIYDPNKYIRPYTMQQKNGRSTTTVWGPAVWSRLQKSLNWQQRYFQR